MASRALEEVRDFVEAPYFEAVALFRTEDSLIRLFEQRCGVAQGPG